MTDTLLRATANAVAYARARASEEVTPDDLLLGALYAASTLGVATFGAITIDLSCFAPPEIPDSGVELKPKYAPPTAAVFDRASGIARTDGEGRMRLVHLLAAFQGQDSELFTDLQERHDFGDLEWRASLAEWDRAARQPKPHVAPRQTLLTVEEAAEALGVHQQTIRGYIRTGKLPAYRIAGERAIRVYASDLYGLLEPLEPSAGGEDGEG